VKEAVVLACSTVLFTKNSYQAVPPPPDAVKITVSPVQAVSLDALEESTPAGIVPTLKNREVLDLPQSFVKKAVTLTVSPSVKPVVLNTLLVCRGPIEMELRKNSYSSPTLDDVI